MHNIELIKRDVKNGWGKKIELMREKLDHSIDVLRELEERTYNRKDIKERLVARQKNRISKIMNWIEDVEQRVETI